MAADDPVETQTPVFTEEEVYMIAGFLAEQWGVEDLTAEIEDAIEAVLSRA